MDLFLFVMPSYVYAQHLFVQLLGFSYLCAFSSLFFQVLGLYGSQGIIPAHETLSDLKSNYRIKNRYLKIPTLFWMNASDIALQWIAGAGMLASILVMLNIIPTILLILLWLVYISYQNIGTVFLSFQWDILLLEVGFIGIFFSIQTPPPTLLLVALWVLLFRFMFSSGWVKLFSGCPEWHALRAMTYHYETQPLPNRIAYYLHQFPKWFTKFSEMSVYFFEMVVPFLVFGTENMRGIAGLLLIFFQFLLMLTGNFAFFNILSITLCVTLFSNSFLESILGPFNPMIQERNIFLTLFLNGIGFIFILLNTMQFISLFTSSWKLQKFLNKFRTYYILNSYGLFACMTTERNEIIIEGSDDGTNWKPYEFRWKPMALKGVPKQVAPYHPRLDWQMWFAALGSAQANPWFMNFLFRLLEGSPQVTQLLKTNPFPHHPPKFVRSLLFQYHFSDLKLKSQTGQWWTRSFIRYYTPTITLK